MKSERRFLLLIPSIVKQGAELDAAVGAGRHPTMDYHALAAGLRERGAGSVDILDYAALDSPDAPAPVRLARKVAGRDAALALFGFLRCVRRGYDAVFTNGENVAIPLALLFRLAASRRRPGHVTIGHRLSSGKKRPFFQFLRADRAIDTVFVYATAQRDYAVSALGIPGDKVALIPFHADTRFYAPDLSAVAEDPNQMCAAGLEWRDYPTLLAAVEGMPDWKVRLAAASPWSKHRNETEKRTLPANVQARRYPYDELRDLYAQSAVVAVPLYETDFQAGVTTLLEAMAMSKAVIVTRTTGQTDVVTDGVNGLTVAPGDVDGWRSAIGRLRCDPGLRRRLGAAARTWVEEKATLDAWVAAIAGALYRAAGETAPAILPEREASGRQAAAGATRSLFS